MMNIFFTITTVFMVVFLILIISVGFFVLRIVKEVKSVVLTLKELSNEVNKEGKKTLHVAGLVRDSVARHPGTLAMVGTIIMKMVVHFFNKKK